MLQGVPPLSRLCASERSNEAQRCDVLKRWHHAREDGLSTAADAVGVSRATLYRWRNLRHRGRPRRSHDAPTIHASQHGRRRW